MNRVRAIRIGCLLAVVALLAGCASPTASGRAATTSGAGLQPTAHALFRCSGTGGPLRQTVSFADMQIRYSAPLRHRALLDVAYDRHTVLHRTTGNGLGIVDLCVAKMAGYRTPVGLVIVGAGACCSATLQVVYPKANGEYADRNFASSSLGQIRIELLGRSLAILEPDPRFAYLFTDGAGSASPVRVMRLRAGRLIDVSSHFPQIIAKDASRLTADTHGQAYRIDGVWAFIGELNAWVADECRLGQQASAWKAAKRAVHHGRYRRWLAEHEPRYLSQLKADLVRWGYCPAGG